MTQHHTVLQRWWQVLRQSHLQSRLYRLWRDTSIKANSYYRDTSIKATHITEIHQSKQIILQRYINQSNSYYRDTSIKANHISVHQSLISLNKGSSKTVEHNKNVLIYWARASRSPSRHRLLFLPFGDQNFLVVANLATGIFLGQHGPINTKCFTL